MEDRYTEWRVDPEGYEYRYNLTRITTEYKPKIPKPSSVPLEPFTVRVRGEVWNVWSKDIESAANLCQADVKEVTDGHHSTEKDI